VNCKNTILWFERLFFGTYGSVWETKLQGTYLLIFKVLTILIIYIIFASTLYSMIQKRII